MFDSNGCECFDFETFCMLMDNDLVLMQHDNIISSDERKQMLDHLKNNCTTEGRSVAIVNFEREKKLAYARFANARKNSRHAMGLVMFG